MSSGNENFYRLTFAVLWVIYFVVRIYFQKKVVKLPADYVRINEKQELLYFRLFALAFILLPLYFLTSWIDFAHLSFLPWLRRLGSVITCAGIALFGWAHQALGKNWTAVLALSKKHELVQSGPYRWIRHPMYTAFFIIGIGFALLSANWLIALIYLTPLTWMYFARVSREEEMMLERFGNRYQQYLQRTGRLWPRLGR